MKRVRLKFLFSLVLLAGLLIWGKPVSIRGAFAAPPGTVEEETPPPAPPPPGFQLISSALGVGLYKKDYPNGNPDFVQMVDLSQGAKVELLHGELRDPRPTKGSFGGPDPSMTSLDITTYWSQTLSSEKQAFCVTNGSFFYMPEYPTRLAFPLKVNGQMITEGWGVNTHPGEHLILELWDDHANIQAMTQASLYASGAPHVLGGLTEEANKRIKYAVGRTFVGVADRDQDGVFETVLILTTRTALQSSAAAVLREFGAEQVMMLDGGGSTQLLCKSGWYIRSDRPVPQALAVIAASPPPIAVDLVKQVEWPVLQVGQGFPLQLEIRNTGMVSWTEATTEFIIKGSSFSIPYVIPFKGTTLPGGQVTLSDTLPAFSQAGVHPVDVEWGIRYQDKNYPGKTIHTYAVVLPEEMADQRQTLETELQTWQKEIPIQSPEDATQQLQAHLDSWMEQHQATPLPLLEPDPRSTGEDRRPDQIQLKDVVWVPLLMLPIVIFLGFAIARRNN
jgi:hypothetical protein